MIRVNLIGASRKRAAKAPSKFALSASGIPIAMALIALGTGLGGYLWYSSTAKTSADLDTKIAAAGQEKAKLAAEINLNKVNETIQKALKAKIDAINSVKKNQVSPVVAMDLLSSAVERTQYVWLSQLQQDNATLSLSGTATSLNALADFLTNLKNTRHFKNIEPSQAVDASGNFNFSLKCEFSGVALEATGGTIPVPAAAPSGGGH